MISSYHSKCYIIAKFYQYNSAITENKLLSISLFMSIFRCSTIEFSYVLVNKDPNVIQMLKLQKLSNMKICE